MAFQMEEEQSTFWFLPHLHCAEDAISRIRVYFYWINQKGSLGMDKNCRTNLPSESLLVLLILVYV